LSGFRAGALVAEHRDAGRFRQQIGHGKVAWSMESGYWTVFKRVVTFRQSRRRRKVFTLRDASVGGRGLQPHLRGASWARIREAAYRDAPMLVEDV